MLLHVPLVLPSIMACTALPVSIVANCFAQGVLSHVDCTQTYSSRQNWLGSLSAVIMASLYVTFRHFHWDVAKSVVLNPWPSHRSMPHIKKEKNSKVSKFLIIIYNQCKNLYKNNSLYLYFQSVVGSKVKT